ncbi:MAG: hypothetical protein LBR69_03075 [Endomicrobium sp.]|jgi:hypothetical protein|nr:hypothetical protein [Endomicrobium sp.]
MKQKYIWYIYRGNPYGCREGLKARGGIFNGKKKLWYFENLTDAAKSFCKILRLKLKKIKIENLDGMKCETCVYSSIKGFANVPEGLIGALHTSCNVKREKVELEDCCFKWEGKK